MKYIFMFSEIQHDTLQLWYPLILVAIVQIFVSSHLQLYFMNDIRFYLGAFKHKLWLQFRTFA